MKHRIGIHALGVAIPRRYVDLADLARARGVDPDKYIHGLGAREMAVAEPGEDTVALAALAARRALACSGLSRQRLGMLVVGTETGVDHSKPVASFVHGLLELPAAMRVYDTQHARYGVATAGEPTQGAGAVAMVVSTDPALVEIDVGISGAASSHVHDFWRPLGLREAQVDGHYSVQCYLDAVSTAYRGWRTRAIARDVVPDDGMVNERLARICYHVPFCKMARKAHQQVRRCDLEDAGVAWDEAAIEAEAPRAAAAFRKQVEPSLGLCARVGNIYTGSLYLGLAGLLHAQAASLVGERIGLFSYGSGCTSEFFSGVVAPGAPDRIAAARLTELLVARERISIPEYERIMALPPTAPLVSPSHASDDTVRFLGVTNHQRQYATR